jgi:hypothetical protein
LTWLSGPRFRLLSISSKILFLNPTEYASFIDTLNVHDLLRHRRKSRRVANVCTHIQPWW